MSIFGACVDSLASENASRLAAMRRAEKNIGEMLAAMRHDYSRLRQNAIDEELFDVISGFEVTAKDRRHLILGCPIPSCAPPAGPGRSC